MAPKPKNIDPTKVETAASIGLNIEEIGHLIGCSADTLQRRFKKELERGWSNMKSSLKRAQYDVAVNKKNPTMLIWMGKQHLGQSDDGGRKQNGVGDQLEAFYRALMSGPAAPVEDAPAKVEEPAAGSDDKPPEDGAAVNG